MKRISKIAAAIDAHLIELVQECYLWVWDRTGITVGAIVFALLLWMNLTTYAHHPWTTVILTAVVGLIAWAADWCQRKSIARFNAQARNWRNGWTRLAYLAVFVAFTIGDILKGDIVDLGFELIAFLIAYLWCVQVRDREPPMKHKLVAGGA